MYRSSYTLNIHNIKPVMTSTWTIATGPFPNKFVANMDTMMPVDEEQEEDEILNSWVHGASHSQNIAAGIVSWPQVIMLV